MVGLHRRAEHIHLVSHQTGMHPVLELQPQSAGGAVVARIHATPAVLEWHADTGVIRAAFDGSDALRVAGDGLGMRFSAGRR